MSPSPRSSVETTQGPTSPLLYNLHHRLRKGSNASRASSLSSDAAQANIETHVPQDTKATKRYLALLVKDDWEYSRSQGQYQEEKTNREAIDYRLRDESASEYESNTRKSSQAQREETYKFDNPDDVGTVIERRRARRHRLLEQEMAWNEGLRIWTTRRDLWVGAVTKRPDRAAHSAVQQSSPSRKTETRQPGEIPSMQETDDVEMINDYHEGPYLPIYPPLLSASHSLRSRIKSTAYPTIYSKVVIQGLAPNVPIPLNHMINALVNGWKAEGNWPPQQMEPQTAVARRKAKKEESAFQRWKREQDIKKKNGANGANHDEPALEHTSVRKSLTGVVKKVFGRSTIEEEDIEQDLERLGLTFATDEEKDRVDINGALANGHV